MASFRIAQEASRDLDEIWAFISADNRVAGDSILEKFKGQFEMLAANPRIGHVRRNVTRKPVLFWPMGRYEIIYQPKARPIIIVAVLHGSRDISQALRKR
jgi:toxin ParE1/3/4